MLNTVDSLNPYFLTSSRRQPGAPMRSIALINALLGCFGTVNTFVIPSPSPDGLSPSLLDRYKREARVCFQQELARGKLHLSVQTQHGPQIGSWGDPLALVLAGTVAKGNPFKINCQ